VVSVQRGHQTAQLVLLIQALKKHRNLIVLYAQQDLIAVAQTIQHQLENVKRVTIAQQVQHSQPKT